MPDSRNQRSLTRTITPLLVATLLAACAPQINSTATSVPVGSATPTSGLATPSLTFTPTLQPSDTPTGGPTAAPTTTPTPAATPFVTEGFVYGDILKVQVDSLAARKAPKRSAGLVHGYDLGGGAPIDDGLVRLDTGDFVSVHLGPVRVGQTVWYLVWPSDHGVFHEADVDWYHGDPGATAAGPGWVAASVGNNVYMAFQRRPGTTELEQFLPVGLNAAGTGAYQSPPQPRHDFHLFDWAAATPVADTSCSLKVTFVPADPSVAPVTAINTTTSTVKVGSLDGKAVNAPWLPAPAGTWTTFTVKVTGTCRWAIRLTPLHHD